MFETSVVRARTQAARGRLSLLIASVIAHTAAILGAVTVSVATIDFPDTAPDEYAEAPVFMPVQIPPPLGNPNGGAPAKPAQPAPQPQKPADPQNQITAPSNVPEDLTPVDAPSTGAGEGEPTGTGTEPGPIGVPWGTDGEVGPLDAPPSPIVPQQPIVEEKVYQPHEVKAPVLLHRVEPVYPPAMVRAGVPATVVVRCIIDKNGHVQDPEVIVPAMPPFNAEVLRVITKWRFTPGSVRGQAVDSYFHLTVTFNVRR